MSSMENWTQTTFRYRNDDGSETAATWRQIAGTDDTLELDTTYRMRFNVAGTHTGGAGSFPLVCGFQYDVDGAGFVNITTTSTNVKAVASADTSWTITDDDVTTEQLAGAATFVAGHMDETGACSSVTISDSEDSEFELVFQLLSSELSGGESVQIRCVDSGTALNTYTLTPTITVATPPSGGLFMTKKKMDGMSTGGAFFESQI